MFWYKDIWQSPWLQTLDAIGNCQRLVFTVGVSQHMHQITNLWNFELNRLSKLQDINERKNTLVAPSSHEVVCFQNLDFKTSKSISKVSKSNLWKITSFPKNFVTSEGAVSHNVLYYQQLSITHYQLRFILRLLIPKWTPGVVYI